VTNVKKHTNTQGLEHVSTRDLEAELESRKSATPHTDVYTRCGVRDEHRDLFDAVVYAICTEGESITEVSTPGRAGFIHGNAKNWVRDGGNLAGFKAMFSAGNGTIPLPTNIGERTSVKTGRMRVKTVKANVPPYLRKYLRECADAGKGFCSKVICEDIGKYQGVDFARIRVGQKRYVVGKLKTEKVQRFKETTYVYRNVDRESKLMEATQVVGKEAFKPHPAKP